MDRATLHKILENAYNHREWLSVLKSVFGAKQLYAQPKSILLPNNERAIEAFELGSFTTSDDRIIGLYRINVKPDVWIERNKVSLRELLRNVYKYDVDGAIVVFVQDDKWRLSFISEIKMMNDEGEIIKQATESKRYTYLLGEDEKVRTPSERLSKLSGKILSLQDLLNAFSVEALNEEFYKIVQSFFYKLVGGKIGKGKKITDYGEGILTLPNNINENRQVYQEFAVRLIGRTVFCWFLKMKKSDAGIALLPEHLLSSSAVKENKNYYHAILERLFFQTLNTPIEERVDNLPKGAESIPFLNGGLFEPNNQDFYKLNPYTRLNEYLSILNISDEWFYEFFLELEKYNFTIDENSVVEVEVSVDPEMLGRIFENLLAEIDPDSGETARKATGSFYTPREIVDYMATESLVQYLHNQTCIDTNKLRPIFKMMDTTDSGFTTIEKDCLLDALDKIRILDPACGSGAFPMGMLQKIVQALQKLDKDAIWWKKRQVDRISNVIVKKRLKEKLADSGVEYARKIGIVQNSLYGVDIQPIAAEISKLRCFLSLIVDENINETLPNRGIEPLPNLEFKFVTADTLVKLPEEKQRGFFDNFQELQQLEELRNEYIQSYGKTKRSIKENFLKVQQKIAKVQSGFWGNPNSKAYKLGHWNPFGHEKSDWFDPKWMFGIDKFDVVIGNPPYVDSEKMTKIDKEYREFIKQDYKYASGNWDLFLVFVERGIDLLSIKGSFSYIIPNKLIGAKYAIEARKQIAQLSLKEIRDYSRIKVFKTADVYPITIVLSNIKNTDKKNTLFCKVGENYTVKNTIEANLSGKDDDVFWDKYFLEKESFILLNKIGRKRTVSQHRHYNVSAAATVSDAYLLKEILIDDYNSDKKLKVVNTGTIDPYINLWGIKPMQYIKDKYEYPVINPEQFKKTSLNRFNQAVSPKIIIAGMSIAPEAYLDTEGKYIAAKSTTIVFGELSKLYVLLVILNSNLIKFYISNQYLSLKMAGGYLNINPDIIKDLPLPDFCEKMEFSLRNIAEYLIFLKKREIKHIDDFVGNSHIFLLFEDIINAMVMELYFKEEFEKVGVEFIKYVERDFESIQGKTDIEAMVIIKVVYQKLCEKNNEIRNNLKLMDIKLADIVMPIKTAK